ncbi:MAG: AarF/UbiB family protein [Acidobacteriota bacterium]|nr:AarF/UbiB family protein [Acidobacteriota bacterium]
MKTSKVPKPTIDRRRYRKVRWFFLRLAVHLVWWDLILARPGLRRLRRPPHPRWQRLARQYRALAVDLGGVMIKLGQYLSTRVDVLPPAVTRELAGLQDEVPAESFESVARQMEAELEAPLAQVFMDLEPEPLGAASLAQVHGARLLDGSPVVVKVLRPGIETLVETDLAAISVAAGWLEHLELVRSRVDLDALLEEFRTTTRRELDLENEGHNAERFADNFAGDHGVIIPEVYWETTRRRLLTLENVAYLKIGDVEALSAAGIDRKELARRLYRAYMEQIFVHHFVHADPHPGNLFVRPLPLPGEDPEGFPPGTPVPDADQRPFQIVFVDFGMVAEVPERLRRALREVLIGFGSRDAGRVVRAAYSAGILLPGADLEQLQEALETVLDRFWGVELGRLNDLALSQARELWREFGRLILETPVQVQSELLFTGRAAALLGGLATQLDPGFEPWSATIPFAARLAAEEARGPEWAAEALRQGREALGLPAELARLVRHTRVGKLTVRNALAPDTRRRLDRLERGLARTRTAVAASGLAVAGAVLYALEAAPGLGAGMLGAAAVLYLMAWWR